MDKLLKTWIAESESWQSFIDFNLPIEARANYPFLERTDDFFLSLMHRCFLILKKGDFNNKEEEILALAKGLEIYSLAKKRNHFKRVSYSNNILFSAGLYYLSNYSASAWILSKIYPFEEYSEEIDLFISSFLKRESIDNNEFGIELNKFLEVGDFNILESLMQQMSEKLEIAFNESSEAYTSFILASAILVKFYDENIWTDLLKINGDNKYWEPLVSRYLKKKVPIWSLFPSQKQAIQKGVLSEMTCSLQMPTSSGKTFISEIIIYNEIKRNPEDKILYLAPFRALASELKTSLARNLAALGIKSKTIYGGNIPTVEERNSINEANLLIATPEKFMAIEDIFPDIHKEFKTIICDEGHLLDDSSRGLSYELLLSRIKEDKSQIKKFVFISAIIPNINIINSWLGGREETLITSNYRPTELEFAFLRRMASRTIGYSLDINPTESRPKNYQLYRFLYDDELKLKNPTNNRTSKINNKKGISSAVAIKATKSGSVALFSTEKRGNRGVETLAEEVLKQLDWKENYSLIEHASEKYIESLVAYFSKIFGADYLLVKTIRFGFLYHHGDFPQGVREIIEDSLREGKIKMVICTNTLAEGVNLPIKTIVIHSTIRFNPNIIGNYEQVKTRDLKNLVGRAGRAGKETKGLVIVPHNDDFNKVKDLINETNVEPVKGQLYNIIQSITDALARERLQLTDEIMDELSDYFQSLFDTIDLSMIDLLAEEVDVANLDYLVKQLISQTLSYYQSSDGEKETLEAIFSLRSKKLLPYLNSGEFKHIKNSGATLRLYDDIKENIDFDDDIWTTDIIATDVEWLDFIIDNSLFKLKHFNNSLNEFNTINRCEISNDDVKLGVKLWMEGAWFNELAEALKIEMHQSLRFVNSFLSFNIQNIIATIIRLSELTSIELPISDSIKNWPAMLQYGVSTEQELNIFEMGLIDRVAVLELSKTIELLEYVYTDYKGLKSYILSNKSSILENISSELPIISKRKIESFYVLLRYKDMI